MKRRTFNKLLGAGLLAGAAPTIIRPAAAADPFGVGFIYVGPVEDFGWTHAHDVGRKAIEAKVRWVCDGRIGIHFADRSE